jgi:hypothetical protein
MSALIVLFLALLSPAHANFCKSQAYASAAVLNGWGEAPVVAPVTAGASCVKRLGESPWLVRGLGGGGSSFTPAGPVPLAQAGFLAGRKIGRVILWTGYVHNMLITPAGVKHVPTGTIALAKPLLSGKILVTSNILVNTVGLGAGVGVIFNF